MTSTDNPQNDVKLFSSFGSDIDRLSIEDQRVFFKKSIEAQLTASKNLQDVAIREFKAAIKKAKITQTWILGFNIIMFFFGIVLISIAVYASFTNMSPMYSILFGGIGFAELVSTFFIGAMQRSQKSVSDLVQVEISFLNYFEQVTLWEQYGSIRDQNGVIQKENLAEAAKKIQESTSQTLDLLQKYVEATTS